MMMPSPILESPARLDAESLKRAIAGYERRELPLDRFHPASVLIPILAAGGPPRLVLTVRTAHVEHHKNQISFPGGHQEADETDADAALREAEEEVGLPRASVELLGRLDDIYTISDYRVTPFVGWIDAPVALTANPYETAQILQVPIEDLLDPKIHRADDAEWNGDPIRLHFYYWYSHIIWGATGLILTQFLDICRGVLA